MQPRLSLLEKNALGDFAAAVRALFGERLRAITLFGSRARGAGRDDSDLDIFVLIEGMTRDDRRAVVDLGADVGLAHRLVLSPLVADVAKWRTDLPLAAEIARDGRPL